MTSSMIRRTRRVAMALWAVVPAPSLLAAQSTHTTAPPVMSWSVWLGDVAGHRIWVSNEGKVPVVITKMRISNCVNVQTPCRDSTLDVRILASKEVYSVARILPVDPKRPFSYGFGVDWRVATECSGIVAAVPAGAGDIGLMPPELIEFQLPPGPYADKWPGSFPVQFFVAADGATDSTVLAGFAPGGYRDILQRIFSEYRFRPGRFKGCPVKTSTEIRIQVAGNLPKPSVYEGFPPTPSELARDTRGPENPTSPAEPYVVHGACPFECCEYGEWQATAATKVYATEGSVRRLVFTLRTGDSVRATTGSVHVSRAGRVKIVGRVEPGWATFGEEHVLPVPAIGDTVYVLSYDGEGTWQYWYRGLVGSGEQLWLEQPDSGKAPGELLVKPVSQWWVHIIDRRGRSGWVIVPPTGFLGSDGCG